MNDTTRSSWFVSMGLLAMMMAAWCLPSPLRAEVSGTTPRYPHVVWHEDPAHRATIVWVTGEPGESHAVHYGPDSRDGALEDYRHRVEATRTVPEYGEHVYFHHAELTDLHPSATYHFTVVSDGKTSKEWHFETAPADDRPVTLLYGGDSRSSRENRQRVNRRIGTYVESHDDVIGFVHGGDYIVSGMTWKQWRGWLEDWQLTRTSEGRLLPIVPGRGNHEFSLAQRTEQIDNYNGIFGLPGGTERDYWTTRVGSQIAVVTLDTNTRMAGQQRDWLKQQLETWTDSRRWIVANYHRPAYPAVKSPGAARKHWVPLFEEYDIDLVCESDGHVLKRTVPILEGERDPDGIVYVGEGGLGVPQRTPRSNRWYLEEPGVTTSRHHFQVLEFGPHSLDYRAIAVDTGEVLDQKSFEPAREGTPVPLEIEAVRTPEQTRLHVVFSKGVTAESASTVSNYQLEPSIAIQSARLHDVRDRVAVLEMRKPLDPDETYRLTATNLEDRLGQTLERAQTASFQFGSSPPDASSPDASDAAPPSTEPPSESPSESKDRSKGCSSSSHGAPVSLLGLLLGFGIWLARPRESRR